MRFKPDSRLTLGLPKPDHSEISKEWISQRPQGGFNFIMADPPWHQVEYNDEVSDRNPQAHYQTQPLRWIETLPVDLLAANNCVLWLWTLSNMLDQALGVLESWDFEYKTSGFWTKYNPVTKKQAFGTGYLLRGAGEPFLIATRGKPTATRVVRNCIMAPKTDIHSQKPNLAYYEAERLMPDARRIELFSRTERVGWATYGDQAGTLPNTR